ncbi:MAG: photosynthesis system II assembly factor Ycf48 [Phormidesmis sp. RL_2_1]|nr:photosynthesis system II assembly factor Ycf48 [Phormidesmis sp. RL_2_1]
MDSVKNGAIAKGLKKCVLLLIVAVMATSCAQIFLAETETHPWEVIALPTEASISDVAFASDGQHGWLVGSRTTLLESTDAGKTWEPRTLELGEQRYTFTSIDFNGEEGWLVGQPGIMLHTTDGGTSWSNIPLDPQLPGQPLLITALGQNSAELATDIGAIYQTADAGQHWKGLVQSAVGVVRNMTRNDEGKYVAVSSRGNFYSTWLPGQDAWQPHNRENSKRLQNMGFTQDGSLWLIARGGQMQFGTEKVNYEDWTEPVNPEFASSWGLLDMAYRTPEELWVTGGSGNLLMSPDGGQTWMKDKAVENVPTNFYRVKFLAPNRGYVLGQRGYLLRYEKEFQAA